MEKTNADYLRDILDELQNHEFGVDPFDSKIEEAKEFLDALESEAIEKDNEIKSLKGRLEDDEEDDEEDDDNETETKHGNASFVGLDTINWSLTNRNLKIQMQMEQFIEKLQKQNCTTTSVG